jgi:flavin reductase (DIM6/NTAB) family NADH-FMN oxidoreductase RutF
LFYDPRDGRAPLPFDPLKALVAPRPIGWISTVSAAGVLNLAPYSFFNMVCNRPAIVGFASDGYKHSAANAEATGCFVHNIATFGLRLQMNASSATVGEEIDEFQLAGLTPEPSLNVAAPRVREAVAAFECRYLQTVPLGATNGGEPVNYLVLGEIVGVHIDESILTDGVVDTAKLEPIARLGGSDYAVVREVFQMKRP